MIRRAAIASAPLARTSGVALAVAGAAALLGAASALQPLLALALMALAVVLMLAFAAPVFTLLLVLFLTAIVPYGVQNALGGGGAGLLPSDLLLLALLVRTVAVLPALRLDRRRLLLAAFATVFLALAVLQLVHGLRLGYPVSQVGAEFREVLGYSAFLLALPFLANPTQRRRLLHGLLFLAVLLGLWGMLQWLVQLPFTEAGDAGVREGVALTTAGRGQLQGGLFGFPVALVACYAVLLSGVVRSLATRVALFAAVALNAVAIVLTFERTVWVAAVLGVAFVTLKAGRLQRAKVLLVAPMVLVVALIAFASIAPREFTTARERLFTLAQASSDASLAERVIESRHVMHEIAERPVTGSGFGAAVYFRRPWLFVPAQSWTYTHNSYLAIAWKMGLPAAILLVSLLAYAVARRTPRSADALVKAVQNGAQGALLAVLIVSLNFAALRGLSITAVIGVLLAVATWHGETAEETERSRAASGSSRPPDFAASRPRLAEG